MKGLKYRADGPLRTSCNDHSSTLTLDDDIHCEYEVEESKCTLQNHNMRSPSVQSHPIDEYTAAETFQINQQKMTVLEQRGSNFMQALLCGCLVPAAPVTRLLPTSVLWGYFAFMALDAARTDNDLIHRVLLLFRDKQYITPNEGK